jgi:hypothetical protein
MAIVAPTTGLKTIWLSRKGSVAADASLSDPTVGTDASAALQAVVNAISGPAEIIVDIACKVKNISLPSGITIRGLGGSWNGSGAVPATGIIQAPGGSCVFRNAN